MPEPCFSPGDEVRVVSARHRVGAITGPPQRRQGQFWYPVFFGPGQVEVIPEGDLEPYTGTGDVVSMLCDGRFGGRESLSRLVTHLKLTSNLRSQIYALFASKTRFLAYQFKPVLKFIESRTQRLLVADEVGLGKTIEAGLIMTELRHRRPDLARVLIVPPAHLRRKWQEEMRRRFGRHFRVLDTGDVEEFLRDYERDGAQTELWGIVSLQTLRGRRVAERWEEIGPQMDLVVFDEAGRLRNPKTRSHRVASLIGESADAMLLLTATPVQTGTEDLFHLLRLLDPEAFDRFDVFSDQLHANGHVLEALSLVRAEDVRPGEVLARLRAVENTASAVRFINNPLYRELLERIPRIDGSGRRERIELQRDLETLTVFGHVLSRTRKRDVQEHQPERRARVWRCHDVSPIEQEFYREVTRICREAYERANEQRGASFGIIQRQRQMASCMVAMVDYVRAAQGEPEEESPELADLEPDEEGDGNDTEGRRKIRPRWEELGDLAAWRRRLVAHDSKLRGLVGILAEIEREEPGAKVIVFTFFKGTANYLVTRLKEHGIEALALTGDTPTDPDNPERDQRVRTIRRFRDARDVRVLVATEVADEGLDLQFAHCMVNYDLPWNPMRIEQRIGRIDRIGQKSPVVQIVNLSMPGTIEDRILELLFERIGIFRYSIGDLEAVLGEVTEELQHELFLSRLTPEEEEKRIRQAADVIERRRQETSSLEEQSQALIGRDEFFLDEVERARRGRRYLSGDELLLYVQDYLAEHHRGCRIQPMDGDERVFRLRVTEGLREAVRRANPPGDRELVLFLSRSASGQAVFTTDPELAEAEPGMDLLSFYHPLVRAVNQHYADHVTELHPVSQVELRTRDVPPGTYLWLLYSTEISGARPIRDLELVAVGVESGYALDQDRCETLLWQMVSEARSVPEARRYKGVPRSVCDAAEEELVTRLNAKFEDRRRVNDALVANRLASLRETYRRNREIRLQRIREAQERRRKESYIRGLQTRLTNLDEGYRAKAQEVEAMRDLTRSFKLEGGGVVEVRDGR